MDEQVLLGYIMVREGVVLNTMRYLRHMCRMSLTSVNPYHTLTISCLRADTWPDAWVDGHTHTSSAVSLHLPGAGVNTRF